MNYADFINKAAELTITQADNGLFYLEPLWQGILEDNEMSFAKTGKLSRSEVLDTLKLEVERRNTINSKKNDVIEWVYDIISATVEPAILEEETNYIKNVMEYMKLNHELNKSGDYDGDENIDNIVPFPTKD